VAYQAQLGVQIKILHPVRDINGAFVAGQAAGVTKSLIKPDRTIDSVTVVTKSDHAVAGWVEVTVSLPLLGTYTLELTNPEPPTADGRITPYDIVVSAGVLASATLLTSRDRVRTRLQLTKEGIDPPTPISPSDAHTLDSLIDLLISEVSDEYQKWSGRTFAEATYTEYLDGSGRSSLVLGGGPLVSITSLESVEYQDDGAGGVTEVRTTVKRHTYVLAGLRTQPRYTGLGRIDFVGNALFTRGAKNYRVVYLAGFASLPEALVGLATTDVVYRLMTRVTGHLLSQMLGDGTVSFLRPQQMQEAREQVLGLYLAEAA